jgi:hypothetical protein
VSAHQVTSFGFAFGDIDSTRDTVVAARRARARRITGLARIDDAIAARGFS